MTDERDESIVEKIKEGDISQFNELVLRHQRKLYGLAFRILGNADDAAEAVQAAFLQAFKKINSFNSNSAFYTWLYRITTNQCYRKLQTIKHQLPRSNFSIDEIITTAEGKKVTRDIIDEKEPSPMQQAASLELQHTVRNALKRLSKKDYEVVLLRDIEGHSYEEIAGILGCSKGTVESRLFRARARLKRQLERIKGEL